MPGPPPYVAPVPFDYNALNAGLANFLNVAVDIPGSALGGTAQDGEQSFYFPDTNSADGIPLAKLTYTISGIMGLGWDEWRVGYDPSVLIPGDTYVNPATGLIDKGAAIYSSEGNRKINVSIKCECWDLLGSGAIQYIERLKTRLNLPSFAAVLRTLRVAQNDVSSTRTLRYTDDDGRSVSVAQFDLKLNAADAAVDDPLTTIEILGPLTRAP
jgi:hypothetical protein